MLICELCSHYAGNSECRLGLKIPKGMTCREFGPAIERFCSDPNDFVSAKQIMEMAVFFGMARTELKKVKLMAAQAESARA
jgi:hypothetical protein